MAIGTIYADIITRMETMLTDMVNGDNDTLFKDVGIGAKAPFDNLPGAYILPAPFNMDDITYKSAEWKFQYDILIVFRDESPRASLLAAIDAMQYIIDTFLADRTLNGLARDTIFIEGIPEFDATGTFVEARILLTLQAWVIKPHD